ncbi:MAG: hypothetical protein ACLRM8_07440 [Alistipes sp.]
MRLSGYAAYGTRDGMFKGGGSELAFNRRLTRKLCVSGRHDVMQLGAGPERAHGEQHPQLAALARRLPASMVNRGEIGYEHEWSHGTSNFLGARIRRSSATATCAGASTADRKLRIGRGCTSGCVFREQASTACPDKQYKAGLPRPDARIHGRRSAMLNDNTNTTASRAASTTSPSCRRWATRTSPCRAARSSARYPTRC